MARCSGWGYQQPMHWPGGGPRLMHVVLAPRGSPPGASAPRQPVESAAVVLMTTCTPSPDPMRVSSRGRLADNAPGTWIHRNIALFTRHVYSSSMYGTRAKQTTTVFLGAQVFQIGGGHKVSKPVLVRIARPLRAPRGCSGQLRFWLSPQVSLHQQIWRPMLSPSAATQHE